MWNKKSYDPDNLSYSMLAVYALPLIPLNAIMLPIFLYVPTYYAQEMGISLALVGALIFLSRIWDGVSDPMIGVLSDKTRSRFGRRKPWMAIGAVIASISAYFLFLPPGGSGSAYLMVWLVIAYLGWTMVAIPHNALGTEITRNYYQRSKLMAFRDAAEILGFMLVGLAPVVLSIQGERFAGQVLNVLAIPLAIMLVLFVIPVLLFMPKGYSPEKKELVEKKSNRHIVSDFIKNYPYVRLCSAMCCARIGEGMRATLAVIFISYYWGRSDIIAYSILILTIGSLLSVPMWLWLSRKIEKGPTWWMVIALSFCLSPVYFFIDAQNTVLICLLFALTGAVSAGNTLLPSTLLGDVIDLDTLRSRELRAGSHISVWSFLIKLVYAVPVIIVFPVLEAVGFNVKVGAENDADAIRMVGIIYALGPIVFQLIAAALVWNFPLTKKKHDVVRRRIESRNKAVAP